MSAATWAATGALFLMSASFVLAKTGRDVLFFGSGGLRDLPLMYVGMAMLSMPVGLGTLSVMRRLGSRRTCVVAIAATALGLCVLAGTLHPGPRAGLSLAFISIPLAFGVLFSMTWLLVPATVTAHDARIGGLLARAGTGALAGGLAGGLLARGLASSVSPQGLMVVAAVVLAPAAALVEFAQRPDREVRRQPAVLPQRAEAAAEPGMRGAPAVWLLMTFGALAGIVGVLVEFQFYAAVSGAAGDAVTADRFANLYLGMNGAALVALAATPVLQRLVGLGGTVMLLPAAVSVVSSLVWLGAGAGGRSALRLAEGGLKASTHRVGWEQVFARVTPERRTRLKLMVDGMATRLAEGATGAALLLVGRTDLAPRAAYLALLVAAGAWVLVTAKLWGAHLRTGGDAVATAAGARLPDS